MDIFGNKVKKGIEQLDDVREVINGLESSISKLNIKKYFSFSKNWVSLKGRRIVNVADAIGGYDAVTKSQLDAVNDVANAKYTSILTTLNNYYSKKDLEKVFSDYYTKGDLSQYINKTEQNQNNVYDKQTVEFTFMTGLEHQIYTFEYDFLLKKVIVIGKDMNKDLTFNDFDVSVNVHDKLHVIEDKHNPILIHKGNFLTVRLKESVKTVPVDVKLLLFGELASVKDAIDEDLES